jgi:hypothetical protein
MKELSLLKNYLVLYKHYVLYIIYIILDCVSNSDGSNLTFRCRTEPCQSITNPNRTELLKFPKYRPEST